MCGHAEHRQNRSDAHNGGERAGGRVQVTLEVIARGREQGALQSELPKLFKKQATNFSYSLRKLLALGLVTKTPVKLRTTGTTSTTNSTALLHHIHFAPGLSDAPIKV